MLKLLFWASIGLVVYVYLGYPVLVDLLSRLRKAARDSCRGLPELPRVTVIIPAHNEERWIARKIENTLALNYPRNRVQILIGSDGSSDSTVGTARQFVSEGVEVAHFAERAGKCITINRLLPKARGDIILFTDANALLEPDVLQRMLPHFTDPQVGCVTGNRTCAATDSPATDGEGLYWRYENWIRRSESQIDSCLGGYGQILAARRPLVRQIPGASDDFHVPMQILVSTGKRVVFEPHAIARIPAAATLGQELERKIRSHVSLFHDSYYLRDGLKPWKSTVWWQFWSHHVLRLFVPYALLMALLSSAFLWRAAALYRVITIGQCVFYMAAATGYLLTHWGIRMRIVYIPFYFVFANLAVFLAWVRWARGKHQYAWQRTERTMPTAEPAPPLGRSCSAGP
jgi:cellulose synthase/poly-beta-1,6-N-acetylglucosamine synthase-like glycosyltransferase